MICSSCKKELEDGSKFCEFCGAKQEEVNTQAAPQQVAPEMPQQAAPQMTQQTPPPVNNQYAQRQPMDPNTKKLIAIVAAVAVVVIVAASLFMNRKIKIDLNDYVKVEFEGYDTAGTASVEFDNKKFSEALLKSRKFKAKLKEEDLLDEFEEYSADIPYASMIGLFEYELDKKSSLSNGDTVKISYDIDKDDMEEAGLKIVGEKKSFKVKGLKKVKEVDVFDGVTVEFSGTSPDCQADIVNNSTAECKDYVYFSIDGDSNNLAKGDKVIVKATADEETLLSEFGCKLAETQKEFTVENVDEYVAAFADIDEVTLEKLKTNTQDVINAYLAEEADSFVASALTYEGCYFLNTKDAGTWGAKNKIYVVFSSEVKGKEKGSFKKTKTFFPVYYGNLIKYKDGSIYIDYGDVSIQGYTDLSCNWDTLRGYTSKDIMLNNLVTAELAEYSYEASDNLK